jgi:2-haloacid dehalogenase
MSTGPTAAFDVLGTMFSLDRPRQELAGAGAPPEALELWFAQMLRDAFALSHAGGYRPMREMLEATLGRILAQAGMEARPATVERVMAAFGELDPLPGAGEACRRLAGAGWKLITLTNAGTEATRRLLSRAGLEPLFAEMLSCDMIEKTKPHPDVYGLAKEHAVGELWLIAAHGWDVMGAARAGLKTVWISHPETEYLADVFPEPDIVVPGLIEAADRLLEATRT